MKKKNVLIVFVVLLLFVLAGCSNSSKQKTATNKYDKWLIGSWDMGESERGHFFYELYFYDDGTVTWGSKESDNYAEWNIVNKDQLKFAYNDTLNSDYSGIDLWTIEMEDEYHLKLTDENGKVAEYTKQ